MALSYYTYLCSMSKKDSEDVPQTPSTDTVPEGSFNEVDGTAENLTKLSEAEQSQEATTPLIQTTLVSILHSTLYMECM